MKPTLMSAALAACENLSSPCRSFSAICTQLLPLFFVLNKFVNPNHHLRRYLPNRVKRKRNDRISSFCKIACPRSTSTNQKFFTVINKDSSCHALMAEWLRRVIRNHLGSSRAGSNPVQCAHFYRILIRFWENFHHSKAWYQWLPKHLFWTK